MLHQRLMNEAMQTGTDQILQQMPVEHSDALEQVIRRGIRQAVLHYAHGLETLERQLHPLQRMPERSSSR